MPILKTRGFHRPSSGMFAVAGSAEKGVAKAFALLISVSPAVFQVFMKTIGYDKRIDSRVFRDTTIRTEVMNSQGRTDIELEHSDLFHVIIECKVRGGAITHQVSQYDHSFNPASSQRFFCGISQRQYFRLLKDSPDIRRSFLHWFDIVEALRKNDNTWKLEIVRDFIGYIEKEIKVSRREEILVQDVGVEIEIERFFENNIYRRDPAKINPLYFAPYFTRSAMRDEGVGISYISPVLAILTGNPKDLEMAEQELLIFSGDKPDLATKWLSGIKRTADPKDYESEFTYFFLGDPEALTQPLRKSTKPGMSKGWIASRIPRNRCITFSSFLQQLLNVDD